MSEHFIKPDNDELSIARRIHDALSRADLEYSAYSCSGLNIFGDRKSIEAANRAFHSHDQIDDLQRNLRHWRDECGKLHAQIATLDSDLNDLDAVIHELGIADSHTTPAEAVRELKESIELIQAGAARLSDEEREILAGIRKRYADDHNIVTVFTILDRVSTGHGHQ